MGIDGCSAPNYAMPLANLARGYARLASGSADPRFGQSFAQLADAMTAHPELVSGTAPQRPGLHARRPRRLGDQGRRRRRAGVASQSRGAGLRAQDRRWQQGRLHAATVAVLDQLGWLDARQREELRPWRAEAIANWRGTQVGERRPVFKLERVSLR